MMMKLNTNLEFVGQGVQELGVPAKFRHRRKLYGVCSSLNIKQHLQINPKLNLSCQNGEGVLLSMDLSSMSTRIWIKKISCNKK